MMLVIREAWIESDSGKNRPAILECLGIPTDLMTDPVVYRFLSSMFDTFLDQAFFSSDEDDEDAHDVHISLPRTTVKEPLAYMTNQAGPDPFPASGDLLTTRAADPDPAGATAAGPGAPDPDAGSAAAAPGPDTATPISAAGQAAVPTADNAGSADVTDAADARGEIPPLVSESESDSESGSDSESDNGPDSNKRPTRRRPKFTREDFLKTPSPPTPPCNSKRIAAKRSRRLAGKSPEFQPGSRREPNRATAGARTSASTRPSASTRATKATKAGRQPPPERTCDGPPPSKWLLLPDEEAKWEVVARRRSRRTRMKRGTHSPQPHT